MLTKILIIPGLGDSGDAHWQTYWLNSFDNSIKLNQDNWDEPELNKWLERMNEIITKLDCPVILVAHSLAVALVVHWSTKYNNPNVKGAMLVAPADVDSPAHTPDSVRNFAPIPIKKLPFHSILVASENDTFVDFERAKYFATKWGSEFVSIGSNGHINSDSNLKFWDEGQLILQKLF